MAEVALNTQLAAAAGVIGASVVTYAKTRSLDVGMAGNGAIAGLVGITAPSGFVEFWAAPIIGFVAGVIVVFGVYAIDKRLDDPVGALSAHGLAGVWGTLAVGLFASDRLILDGAAPGIWYGIFGDASLGSAVGQFAVQAVGVAATFLLVFGLSYATFFAIKKTIGLRVSEDGGACWARHQLARDVRLPRGVHPRRRSTPAEAQPGTGAEHRSRPRSPRWPQIDPQRPEGR